MWKFYVCREDIKPQGMSVWKCRTLPKIRKRVYTYIIIKPFSANFTHLIQFNMYSRTWRFLEKWGRRKLRVLSKHLRLLVVWTRAGMSSRRRFASNLCLQRSLPPPFLRRCQERETTAHRMGLENERRRSSRPRLCLWKRWDCLSLRMWASSQRLFNC